MPRLPGRNGLTTAADCSRCIWIWCWPCSTGSPSWMSVPEMTALIGGMRALNANAEHSANGVFTNRPGTLSNDFFVNLLDMSTTWTKSTQSEGIYEGHDRKSGQLKWTATPVDLAFGSNSELRAISEVYASSDGGERFVRTFVQARTKVMTLDRFDVKTTRVASTPSTFGKKQG